MPKRTFRYWALVACVPLAVTAQGQFELNPESDKPAGATTSVAGKAGFDLIPLRGDRFGFPLRYGNIVPKSERVELDGRTLTEGTDYAIDYASGTVYVRVPFREGQSLRVSYRYDNSKAREGTYGLSAADASSLKFTFAPGASAVFGLGLTERNADGSTWQSNVFGLATNMTIGGGSLKGLFMVGQRELSESFSLLGEGTGNTDTSKAGTGTALVQEYETKAMGGTVKATYQDIDEKFSGFQSFQSAGYDQQAIKHMEAERGLKRSSFSLTQLPVGMFNLGTGYRTVGNAEGEITWRTGSLNFGEASVVWNSQYVDPTFADFHKLREDDKNQLMKERGLHRDTISLIAPSKFGKFSFDSLSVVANEDGGSVLRHTFGYESDWFKGSFLQQSVSDNFTRFNDLREGDRGQLAREGGVDRENLNLAADRFGLKFGYATSRIGTEEGAMRANSFSLAGSNWSVSHSERGTDEGFGIARNLTGEDMNLHVGGILSMYRGELKPNGHDNNGFFNMEGLNRENWRVGFAPWKSFDLQANRVLITAPSGQMQVNDYTINANGTQLSYREQLSDSTFADSARLLNTEQQVLGTVDGLNRRDFGLNTRLFGMGFNYQRMDAADLSGGAHRERFSLDQKNLQFNYVRRAVDQDFTNVRGLVDPERDHLSNYLGFSETEMSGVWSLLPGLQLKFKDSKADSTLLDQARAYREASASWNLSKLTSLSVSQVSQSIMDQGNTLLDRSYEQMSLSHMLGKDNKLTLIREQHSFDGDQDTMPDAITNALSYQHKLNDKTSFTTHQSETTFEGGERETTSSNTISTHLTDRIGISLTDTRVRRAGDKPDETRRNYGFWVDFGGGVKLQYGYNRDMRGESYGVHQTNTTLSGGEFGGLKFGGATYRHDRLDGQRETHFGDVNFANAKPFQLGAISDINFHYRTNTHRDLFSWRREDLSTGISMAYGQVGFGYTYSSQISPSGTRAIDRIFSLTTDKDGDDRLVGTFAYGVRTMPEDDDVMIRDYALTYQASKNLSLKHALVTNPKQNRDNVLLGSLPLDERRSNWVINYQNDPSLKFDLNWSEIKREAMNESLKREARFNMTMFADNPSPMMLSYGLQQWDRNGNRYLSHSFGIGFNQRPGPNQSLSFSLENFHFGDGRPENSRLHNWGMRLDYNVRF